MKPSAQVLAAIQILEQFEISPGALADILRVWGRANRYAGSKDRAAISGLVYESLRKYLSSAYLLQSKTPRARVLGALWQYLDGDMEKCQALFDGSKYGAETLGDGEINSLTKADLSGAPLSIRADVPAWLEDELSQTFGDALEHQLAAFRERAPLDIRINHQKTDRDRLLEELGYKGLFMTPHAQTGMRWREDNIFTRLPNLEQTAPFANGHFEIQDEASQICVMLCANTIPQNGRFLDFCAGAGGKSLGVAGCRSDVSIIATDLSEDRLRPLKERAERAGADHIEIRAMDALAGDAGEYDCVLVDAPCSGSGTWRRRPDSKWRFTEKTLKKRLEEQKDGLEMARQHVAPGGVLVYATCSILACENTAQIEMFLQKHKNFTLQHWQDTLPELSPGISAFAAKCPFLQLSPASSGTDGFFMAVLKKLPS